MSDCRYDSEREDYLIDGEPCRHDAYGDPTKHCTARRTCSEHVGQGELTCARCVGRTRVDIRVIRDRAAELWPVALHSGVNSEAANLAGPAADVEAWSWRKVAAKQGRAWHASMIEDDDEYHPYSVLCRYQMMLSEDYRNDLPDIMGIAGAADYLERILAKVAQDDEQDFPLFAREIRKCRNHLENVLRDSQTPERGAPCPECQERGHVVRMTREYPHWCEDPDCDRFHYSVMVDPLTRSIVPDTTGDWWICSRDKSHNRPNADYEEWIEARLEARRGEKSVI